MALRNLGYTRNAGSTLAAGAWRDGGDAPAHFSVFNSFARL